MSANGEGTHTDAVKQALAEHSKNNIDEYIKASTFSNDELHDAVRAHIAVEYKTWFFYRKLGNDAGRSNIALHGFSQFFKRSAIECFNDGMWLESYLIQRGGRSKPSDIPAPDIHFPDDPVDCVIPVFKALQAEKELLESCLRLAKAADEHDDSALEDIIESRFLYKETRHVKDMGDFLQQCVRVAKQPGHGLYHLDKELREGDGKLPWSQANHPDNSDRLFEPQGGIGN